MLGSLTMIAPSPWPLKMADVNIVHPYGNMIIF